MCVFDKLQRLWRSPSGRGKPGTAGGASASQSSQQPPGSYLDVDLLGQLEPLASLTPGAIAAAATDANLDGAESNVARSLVSHNPFDSLHLLLWHYHYNVWQPFACNGGQSRLLPEGRLSCHQDFW
jgi:hypothetical protein